jgi:hypothetical protein
MCIFRQIVSCNKLFNKPTDCPLLISTATPDDGIISRNKYIYIESTPVFYFVIKPSHHRMGWQHSFDMQISLVQEKLHLCSFILDEL